MDNTDKLLAVQRLPQSELSLMLGAGEDGGSVTLLLSRDDDCIARHCMTLSEAAMVANRIIGMVNECIPGSLVAPVPQPTETPHD